MSRGEHRRVQSQLPDWLMAADRVAHMHSVLARSAHGLAGRISRTKHCAIVTVHRRERLLAHCGMHGVRNSFTSAACRADGSHRLLCCCRARQRSTHVCDPQQ